MSELFREERERNSRLQATVQDLTSENREAAERITQQAASEKALTDKTRDMVSLENRLYKFRKLTDADRRKTCTS